MKCMNCGKCCENILLVSKKEINQIKTYLKNNPINPNNPNSSLSNDLQKNVCPFRNEIDKKCKIYDIRPSICRSYECSSMGSVMDYEGVKPINMLHTFFPDEYTGEKPNLKNLNKRVIELQRKLHLKTFDEIK